MTIENRREIYLSALATVGELVLLGERYIPKGPQGAYTIIDDVMGYVQSLEREIVRLRTAQSFQAELIRQTQPSNQEVITKEQFDHFQKTIDDAVKGREANKTLNDIYETGRMLNQRFPKVTL